MRIFSNNNASIKIPERSRVILCEKKNFRTDVRNSLCGWSLFRFLCRVAARAIKINLHNSTTVSARSLTNLRHKLQLQRCLNFSELTTLRMRLWVRMIAAWTSLMSSIKTRFMNMTMVLSYSASVFVRGGVCPFFFLPKTPGRVPQSTL